MEEQIKSFSLPLTYAEILGEDPFITVVDIDLMHTGINRNQCIITKESIERSMTSFYNKPLVCLLDTMAMKSVSADFTTHASNSEERDDYIIAGTIPMPEFSNPQFYIDEDGYERFRMRCVIWSFYRENVMRILDRKDGKTKVSVEIIPTEFHTDLMGNMVIDEFNFLGVAFLGDAVVEGMAGSKLEVVNFSYDEMIDKTKSYLFHFEDNNYDPDINYIDFTAKELKTRPALKVNKSIEAISEDNWTTVDKKVLRYDVMRAENYTTIAKEVFLQLGTGWDNGEVSKLKYPVMQIKDEVLVYNRHGLQSAKRMAEKYNEIEVLKKLKTIYDDLHIEFKVKEDKPKVMFDKDKEVENKEFETKDEKIEDKEVKDVEFETKAEDIEDKEVKDEEFAEKVDCSCGKIDCACGSDNYAKDEVEDKGSKDKKEDDDDKTDVEDKSVEKRDDDGNVEKMSSDAYVDSTAQAEMLDDEAEQNEEESDDFTRASNLWKLEKESYEKRIEEYEEKISCYEETIKNFNEEKKSVIVENTLTQFEGKIEANTIAEFTEKAKTFNLENIQSWVNEVKAFAFDNAIEKPITTFAFGTAVNTNNGSVTTNDMWSKYKK